MLIYRGKNIFIIQIITAKNFPTRMLLCKCYSHCFDFGFLKHTDIFKNVFCQQNNHLGLVSPLLSFSTYTTHK